MWLLGDGGNWWGKGSSIPGGRRPNTVVLIKTIQHAQHRLLSEVDNVQMLKEGLRACMLLCCEKKSKQHLKR